VPKLTADPEKVTAEDEFAEYKAPLFVVTKEIEEETVPVNPFPVTSVHVVPEPG
jgi:hypothetical protein